jgi:hypothetical protein
MTPINDVLIAAINRRDTGRVAWSADDCADLRKALEGAGYVIVPKEPTPEMRDPVGQQLGYGADYDEVYRAMVAAAPKP